MPYDYINFSCILNSAYGTPGLYADLTACENAVNDGSVKPVLILNPLWSASKKASLPLLINKLGDGYQQTVFQGVDQINEEWSITSPVLIGSQVNALLNQLRTLSGTSFLWSPNNGVIDYQEFTCEQWQNIRLGVDQYQITGIFKTSKLSSGTLVLPPGRYSDVYFSNLLGYYNSSLGNILQFTGEATLPEPDLTPVASILGAWLIDPMTAIGNGYWSDLQSIPLQWDLFTENAIIYPINLTQKLNNAVIEAGIDNAIFIWLNGEFKYGVTAEGGASPQEYQIKLGSLNPGTHYIQALRSDNGGQTGYFFQLRGLQFIPD
jgi:phage-related protein